MNIEDAFVIFYLFLLAWFFFWLRPRVNDGRLEQKIEKTINYLKSKESSRHHD